MKDRPIIMGADSVRAILEGRKSQTRRVVKPQPDSGVRYNQIVLAGYAGWTDGHGYPLRCPYGVVGDRLWVKESYMLRSRYDFDKPSQVPEAGRDRDEIWCVADRSRDKNGEYIAPPKSTWGVTRNALFMPRWAARLLLELTGVRVEKLQAITHRDALAEGVSYDVSKPNGSPLARFERHWQILNAKRGYPWQSNPYVFVLEFRRLEP